MWRWSDSLDDFLDAGREDCLCFGKDHPKFPLQEEGQSQGTESPERGPVPSVEDRSRSTIYTVLDYADLFSVTLRDDDVQGIRY